MWQLSMIFFYICNKYNIKVLYLLLKHKQIVIDEFKKLCLSYNKFIKEFLNKYYLYMPKIYLKNIIILFISCQ